MTADRIEVRSFADAEALADAVAARLQRALAGPGGVMLAGGTTPLAAYGRLAASGVRAHPESTILLSDERCVPRDHAASNVAALGPLLTALRLRGGHALLPDTGIGAAAAIAADYEARVAAYLASGGRLEVGLLGMGADGHTAALFDAGDLARAGARLAIDVQRPDGLAGVSLTPSVFERFRELMVVVAGAGKRDALSAFLAGAGSSLISRALASCAGVAVWCDAAALGQSPDS